MSTQTDDIISKANAIISDANAISTYVAPGGGGGGGISWPATLDCLAGTVPGVITIVVGDGAPTGQQGEPAYSRRLANMPVGAIGIFGDSIIQMMHQSRMHAACENYALGGQSLRRMINGLPGFSFMHSAGAGIILCGVNDLSNTTYYGPRDNHQATGTVLGMFSNKLKAYLTGKWVICHLLPCNEVIAGSSAIGYNAQVAEVNAGLAAAMTGCAAQIQFVTVDPAWVDSSGNLLSAYQIGDGQHPSAAFCRIYEDRVKAALVALGLN